MIKGIDISEWQGKIDFEKVKKSGIAVVICRYADGALLDDYFDENMAACEKNNLHFGAYIFSRACNKEQARDEARRIIKACRKYKFDMPLYIDCESQQNKNDVNGVIDGFLEICDKEKIKGGIYANLNWFYNYIDIKKYKDRPLWLAQYNKEITDLDPSLFGMWQYTSIGKVSGIVGNVDLNNIYVKYWDDDAEEFPDNIKAMAVDCILGNYGNGEERRERLGVYYEAVQRLVNIIFQNMEENKK